MGFNTALVPTMGVTLIGIFISAVLYGVTSMQTVVYYQKFWSTDKQHLKLLVVSVWLLETAHVFLVCAYIWRSVILEFDDPAALLTTRVSDDITTAVTALIIFLVHCFYARRLWILSNGNVLLVGVVVVLAIVHFGFEMTVMALTFKWPQFSEFHRIEPYFTSAVAIAAADDIVIAGAMSILLHNKRTGIKRTDNLVSSIVSYIITTGILTSITDVVILVTFVAMPNNLVYLCFYDFVNNLYANSFLAILNARQTVHEKNAGIALSTFRAKDSGGGTTNRDDSMTGSKTLQFPSKEKLGKSTYTDTALVESFNSEWNVDASAA